ncbi:putative DNA mismatch repair protein MutL [Lyophyllum shimeji]|uniref:DNA mismatch repair protein PMS1 n=1 Tax=Lyophyllum shimeji TaxID=47721 RepID=A0A9P3PVX7_LYOSH|nr:putative DNA mismatch repair protein MutL [Lyophyllum shimeji]
MERCRIFRTSLANCHNSGGVDNARAYCSQHEICAESPACGPIEPHRGQVRLPPPRNSNFWLVFYTSERLSSPSWSSSLRASTMENKAAIKPIDKTSIHKITSGQVVIDLQTAVKELVENSLDAGATSVEVRFKQYGLKSIEVIDNGSGIAEEYHDSIALKHYTSKLSSFSDLATVRTFGFRGEALSSLCALSESLVVTTATEPPMGVSLEMDTSGKVGKRTKVARQRGTTVMLMNLFSPLPVRRKEFERNVKREFGKALALLNAYALGPCCTAGTGVRLTVTNQVDKGQKNVQLRTSGASSTRAAVSALWGKKALDNIVDLDLTFEVEREKGSLRRLQTIGDAAPADLEPVTVTVKGLVSKFSVGAGRTGTDRQFFYINGRPCNLTKIQKAFNEVYRSFNANQAPFILADFILPTDSVDVNVSPDKRTIFVHSEGNLIVRLKAALEEAFAPSRSTYDVGGSQSQQKTQSTLAISTIRASTHKRARSEFEDVELLDEANVLPSTSRKGPAPPFPSPLADRAISEEPLFLSEDIDEDSHQPSASSALSSRPYAPAVGHPMSPTVSQMVNPDVAPRTELHGRRSPSSPVQPASPTVTQMIDERRLRKDDAMHIDDEDHPPVDRAPSPAVVPGREASVVMDTTAAAWSAAARPAKDIEVELVEDEQGPARKKWKSEPSFGGASVGQGGVRTGALAKKLQRTESSKKARDDLRNKLVGFARMGSQIPASRAHDEGDDEEEVGYTDGGRGADEDEAEDDELEPSSDVEQSIKKSAGLRHDEPRSLAKKGSPIVEDEIGQSSSKAIDLTSDDGLDDARIPPIFEDASSSSLRQDDPIPRPEVIRTTDQGHGDITLRFDLSRISDTWRRLHDEIASAFDDVSLPAEGRVPKDASLANTENNEGAADALARVIEKRDFAEMEIVGQFNLGFIVARRRKTGPGAAGEGGSTKGAAEMDDLFIVDQHAADEKYNFETLQQTTSIKSQRLFKPQAMELTASDELLALENMDVLRQNGFEVEEADADEGAHGARLYLAAQPVSKSTVFDMKDLEELIHLLRDRPTGQMVRCSKARAMFAMRACRKSVMVGMPLNKQQMSLVVSHMGLLGEANKHQLVPGNAVF